MGLIFSPERLTGDILSILNMLAKRKGKERWKTQHKNRSQRQVIMFMVGQNERWILAPMAPQNRKERGRGGDKDTHLCRTTCLCFALHSSVKEVTWMELYFCSFQYT
jgi:hypothetical protein